MKNPSYTDYAQEVALRYQLYNSLFLTLPFSDLERVGQLLPVFSERCEKQLSQGKDPQSIVEEFFSQIVNEEDSSKQFKHLFLFLQLIERQVVLMDAIEENIRPRANALENLPADIEGEHGSIRIVLTAHPTQFYPEPVLGIISDIAFALRENDVTLVRQLLLQLGRTSFSNLKAPTPLSEAENLIHRYIPLLQEVCTDLTKQLRAKIAKYPRIEIGFWPGGDRDGNPFVTAKTTLEVAELLRRSALEFYEGSIAVIRRRITFKGIVADLDDIAKKLQKTKKKALVQKRGSQNGYTDPNEFIADLQRVLKIVNEEHGALFSDLIEELILSVELFGFFTASLDLRQCSDVHQQIMCELFDSEYTSLTSEQKTKFISNLPKVRRNGRLDAVQADSLTLMKEVPKIQRTNGERGLHRYIVSHTEGPEHLLEVLAIDRAANPQNESCALDIVPLFESIDSLKSAHVTMSNCFDNELYKKHLEKRSNVQTIMLGFSDGTKDGGYAACNIAIQDCKAKLQNLAKRKGIKIIFFDGRGGPAARGGGNTHRYYQAVKERIALSDIQLTVQGQTISSHYGTYNAGVENLSLLVNAMLGKKLDGNKDEQSLLNEIARLSKKSYLQLREDKKFLRFLEVATPLWGFSLLNNASRPVRRSRGNLSLGDLRAIPFVGSWAQMKLNIPGYYGLGEALEKMCGAGKLKALKSMYRNNMFFQTLIDNAMQALRKSYLPLTRYLESDQDFGDIAKQIRNETQKAMSYILKVAGQTKLLESDSVNESSIANREKLILPLLVIQQCALQKLRTLKDDKERKAWEKLLLKSIPANINASRNSA